MSKTKKRTIPNANSSLLKKAKVGGAGLAVPPNQEPPIGYAAIVLHVPQEEIINKSPADIQSDLGLPWCDGSEDGIWLDEIVKSGY